MAWLLRAYFGLALAFGLVSHAHAHPHVWITMTETILFTADGKLSGIQHQWIFDEAYSAFAVQGLVHDKDGRVSKDTLAPLAKSNTADLAEFHYFTTAKSDGKPVQFGDPQDYSYEFDGKQIIYKFTLPFKEPVKPGRVNVFDITDPSYFVSFAFANTPDPALLSGGGKGCSVIAKRPPEDPQPVGQSLSEAAFKSLNNSAYGLQFASHIILAC